MAGSLTQRSMAMTMSTFSQPSCEGRSTPTNKRAEGRNVPRKIGRCSASLSRSLYLPAGFYTGDGKSRAWDGWKIRDISISGT